MNTLLLIKQKYESLSTVERKIADFILAREGRILSMSAQEIAGRLNISPAALVRFSRSLGFTGFTKLKQELSVTLANMVNPKDFEEIAADEDVASIKNKLRARMNNMVEQTNSQLDNEAVEKVTEKIQKVDRIFVYGIGASALVAEDISQKFSRIGKTVFFLQDLHQLTALMVTFKKKALFIAISNSGETKEVLKIAEIARQFKVELVAITGHKNSSLARMSDETLLSVSGESFTLRAAATMSLMAQLYVVDILFYSYFTTHYEKSQKDIQITREIIKEFEKSLK